MQYVIVPAGLVLLGVYATQYVGDEADRKEAEDMAGGEIAPAEEAPASDYDAHTDRISRKAN